MCVTLGQEGPDPAYNVTSKSKCLEFIVDKGVVDAVEGILEVNQQDEGRLLPGDGGAHEVDDIYNTTTNVVLRGIGFLLFANDLVDCWLNPVSDACRRWRVVRWGGSCQGVWDLSDLSLVA